MQSAGETIGENNTNRPTDPTLASGLPSKPLSGGGALEHALLHALQAVRVGDFSVRMVGDREGIAGKIADTFNEIAAANERIAQQLELAGEEVGREGRTRQRVKLGLSTGAWGEMEGAINTLIDDLLWPTKAVTSAIAAVAKGDLLQTVPLDIDGRPLKGEFLQAATIVNTMLNQLNVFTSEVTRVAREVGTEGKLGGQAAVPGVAGIWKDLTDSVNFMAGNLTAQVRNIAEVATAIGRMGSWDWDLVRRDCAWDEGQKAIFGVDDAFAVTPASIRRLIHRGDRKLLFKAIEQVRRHAGSHQIEFRICRPDGGVRWCLGTAASTGDSADNVFRVSGVTIDITDRKEAEERQSLLAREVDHRAKNALAVVHAIVCLTRADNIKQYVAAVEGRIQALARVHSLLSESRWRGANITRLIQEELAPFRTPNFDRIRISGRSLSLDSSNAQALALALHELATNSAKYGALSLSTGGVDVQWELKDGNMVLSWIEHDGPPVEHSAPGGFGIRVVKASVESQLGGTVAFDWRREGLRCLIRIPHRVRIEFPYGAPPVFSDTAGAGRAVPAEVGPRRRILLVEDESLIAMAMGQSLRELGFEVVGPFGTVGEAIAAIEGEPIDGAILDVNLAGEMVYPIAHMLQSRKVPFVFMTGYGSETVAVPFPDVRIFQKPIDRDALQQLFVVRAPQVAPPRSAG